MEVYCYKMFSTVCVYMCAFQIKKHGPSETGSLKTIAYQRFVS